MKRPLTFCLGILFSALGLFVFAASAVAKLRAGQAVITLRQGHGVIWTGVYTLRDHPVYFTLVVLRDVSGAVALGGLGLLLTYAAVRSFRDPTGAAVSVRAGQAGRIGAFICMGSLILFVVLRTLPLFLKFGILP